MSGGHSPRTIPLEFPEDTTPDARRPNAPTSPVTLNGGMSMPSWYDSERLSTRTVGRASVLTLAAAEFYDVIEPKLVPPEGGCTPCDVEDDDFEVVEAERRRREEARECEIALPEVYESSSGTSFCRLAACAATRSSSTRSPGRRTRG